MKRRFNSRIGMALLVAALPMVLCGCPPDGRPLTGSGMDMFAPTTMRIHPLTRVVVEKAQIEARIEFTDQMGDITKGVGVLQFNLYKDDFGRGQMVDTWRVELESPAANKQTWDAITRTYLCKLVLKDPGYLAPGKKYILSASMVFPNSTHLDDDFHITVK